MQNIDNLFIPVMAMMGFAFMFSTIQRSLHENRFAPLAFGLMFGIAILLAMTTPIELGEGFYFDLRGLLLGTAVLFAGWLAGLIALCMGIVYRFYLGGGGVVAGVVGLVLSYVIAVLWRRYADGLIRFRPLSDAMFGLVLSTSLVALFTLPTDIALSALLELGPKITIANVVGAVALAFVFRREVTYFTRTQELRDDAAVDPLTKLLNRRGAEEKLARLSGDSDKGRALFYFDLDNFKRINDVHGHAAGDMALAAVAARIENCVRGEVVFSRHGGDEFTLFMPNIDSGRIEDIAERFRCAVKDEPVYHDGAPIRLTISVGVYWTKRVTTFDEMLRRADQQLYRAKDLGRNMAAISMDPGILIPQQETWPATATMQ